MGFIQTTTDPCVYRSSGGEEVYLGVYIDVIIVAARSDNTLPKVKKEIESRFDIKDLGRLHHFFGMKAVHDEATGSVWIEQPAYIESVLKKSEKSDHMTRPNNISNLDSLFHCYIAEYLCFKEHTINHCGLVVR